MADERDELGWPTLAEGSAWATPAEGRREMPDTLHTWRREQLVAEVRTLRERYRVLQNEYSRLLQEREACEAALHALVDGDVEGDPAIAWTNDGPPCPHCRVPGGEWVKQDDSGWRAWRPGHRPDCPVVKARALLQKESTGD